MWQGIGFGESRIASNAEVMKKWQETVIDGKNNRKFLMAGSMKKCGSKRNGGDAIFGQTNTLLPSSTGVDLDDKNNATKVLASVGVAFVALLTISRMLLVFNNTTSRNPACNKAKECRKPLGNHETTPILSYAKDEIAKARS